jgi:hypothetical protein
MTLLEVLPEILQALIAAHGASATIVTFLPTSDPVGPAAGGVFAHPPDGVKTHTLLAGAHSNQKVSDSASEDQDGSRSFVTRSCG